MPQSNANGEDGGGFEGLAALKPVAHLRLKAALLLLFTLGLTLGAAFYLLYARGVFEPVQHLVLVADDSEGVSVGMDMTFSGIPIGRVRRVELAPNGNARILVDVPRKDAHWLRESSVFTLVRGLVGGTGIKAYSGLLDDPPLFDDLHHEAERSVLRADATADLPQVMATAKDIMAHVERMTAPDSSLNAALADLHTLTQRVQGPDGALGLLMGNAQGARRAGEQVGEILQGVQALIQRSQALVQHADHAAFGSGGLMPRAQVNLAHTTQQLGELLASAQHSLTQLDAVLRQAEAVGANAEVATRDLDALRTEVEANLRQLEDMMGSLQGKWPFARQPGLELP